MEGFPSGQREQTVNLLAQPSVVRIRPPPPYTIYLRLIKGEGNTNFALFWAVFFGWCIGFENININIYKMINGLVELS